MAQTEITIQIFEDIESVQQKLISSGFVYQDTFIGQDNYFSIQNIEQIKNLQYKTLINNSIIVRSFFKKMSNSTKSYILHKLKTIDENGNTIGEEKTSVTIDNPSDAIKLLSNANLTNWLTLKQTNHFYINNEITIIIGTVDGLDGCFMEIEEYSSIKHKPESEKFEILKTLISNFNFKTGNDFSCKKSLMLFNKNQILK